MERVGVAPRHRWELRAETPAERERLSRELDLHPLAAQCLVHRGCTDVAEARAFLRPSLRELPDPERLPDFESAAEAVERVLASGEPVLIHGDYDVDGMSGSTLLLRLFRLLDHPAEVFLPDRLRDGYSFSERSLDRIRELQPGLVISVDNGTTAVDFVRRIRALGPELVVVDHHLMGDERPDATALVNPWAAPGDFFPYFCGTAVAYLLAWGVLRRRAEGELREAHRRFLVDGLGLAAMATVTDVMPLVGPNRALVAEGLRTLGNAGYPGLRALLEVAKVRGQVSTEDVGFRLGPRLNAAGRLARTELALELLTTEDAARGRQLALELDALNSERKEVEAAEVARLEASVEAQRQRGDRVLFAGHPEGNFGVLGVVANRFLDATGLPTLLWAECSPGIARGSARAPDGHDLMPILRGAAGLFHSFGGHARAAGFSFDPAQAEDVASALHEAAAALPPPGPPRLEVDAEAAPGDFQPRLVEQLESLAPFGEQNPAPTFLSCELTVMDVRPLGDGSHLAVNLERNGHAVRGLGWRMAEAWRGLAPGDRVDVVFRPGINLFRGRRSVEWTLLDLRTSP
jgi:single-stranded-DNA-specific exonuclease